MGRHQTSGWIFFLIPGSLGQLAYAGFLSILDVVLADRYLDRAGIGEYLGYLPLISG